MSDSQVVMLDEVPDLEDFLSHYGVPGMKWGRRKGEAVSTGKSAEGSGKGASEDATKATKLKTQAKKSGSDSLSNKELKDLVERMNLEQQYNKLNPSKQSAGKKFARELLLDTSKDVAKNLIKDVVKDVVKTYVPGADVKKNKN